MFTAERVGEVLDLVPDAIVDGGWGVDALVGRQTRVHDDLDMVVPLERCDAIAASLVMIGFALALDERPTRVVLERGAERIDLHLTVPAQFGMLQTLPGGQFTYVLDETTGSIGGREARCISAPMQVLTHAGYEPDDDDRADMALVAGVSGESLPPPYAAAGEVVIRPAVLQDAAAISVVRARSWRAAYTGRMPQPVIDSIDLGSGWLYWSSAIRIPTSPHQRMFVAGEVGAVHGFAAVSECRDDDAGPNVGEIRLIYADPSAWDRGVGAALFRAAVEELHAMGFGELRLWTLNRNDRARAFYESFGWQADGATRTVDHPAGTWAEVRYRTVG